MLFMLGLSNWNGRGIIKAESVGLSGFVTCSPNAAQAVEGIQGFLQFNLVVLFGWPMALRTQHQAPLVLRTFEVFLE